MIDYLHLVYLRGTNLNIVIDTGKQSTVSGTGKIFEEFKRTGVLKHFTGYGQKPALSQESHYAEALVRLMTFADTYGNDDYKKSKKFSHHFSQYYERIHHSPKFSHFLVTNWQKNIILCICFFP